MNRTLAFHSLLLVGLYVLLFLPFLGSPVLFDFDEAYFASIAKEMHADGEWIVPTINENELGDKPILIFWGMLVSFSVFGVSEFAVRFPTVCWSLASVLLTYHLARRLFHDANLALRSAFILATMTLFCAHSRITTCDMAMMCWTLAAWTVYVYGSRGFQLREQPCCDPQPAARHAQSLTERLAPWFPQHRRTVALLYACLGGAALAKGPVFCVLPTAVIGLFLLVKAVHAGAMRPATQGAALLRPATRRNPLAWVTGFCKICLMMRPLIAVAAILAVAGPWYLAVGFKTDWAWEKMFFITHNFQRTTGVIRGHTGFPLYYFAMTLLGTFPWSLFVLPCLIDLVRRLRRGTEGSNATRTEGNNATRTEGSNATRNTPNNAFQFLLCGIVLYFTLFSMLVNTKLPHYVMPAYPAFAMLTASYLGYWRRNENLAANFWMPATIAVLCVIGVATLGVLLYLAPKYFPEERLTALLIGSFLTLAGVLAAVVYRRCLPGMGRKALDVVFIGMAVLFVPLIFQYAAVSISRHAHYRDNFFEPVVKAAASQPPPLLIYLDYADPSATYYSGRPIRVVESWYLEPLRESKEEPDVLWERLRNEIMSRDEKRPRYLNRTDHARAMNGQIFLVATERDYERIIRPVFGDSLEEVGRMQRFMRKYDMVMLTPK
ncbi:MAG: glycosyltransferase family 39 protein [Planctomycetaceae bacterium]|nr:glycosyltransferase family 39 protein [Planctomycetaceae bacterium]